MRKLPTPLMLLKAVLYFPKNNHIYWLFMSDTDSPWERRQARGQERRLSVLQGDWALRQKPEGDPRCCRLQNSCMTFSRMLPPACHRNTVWLIKVSVALDFHWHSTPQATLGALRQAIHTEGRRWNTSKKRVTSCGNSWKENSLADPSNNTQSQKLSITRSKEGRCILECKSTGTNMHAPLVFYISSDMVCPS